MDCNTIVNIEPQSASQLPTNAHEIHTNCMSLIVWNNTDQILYVNGLPVNAGCYLSFDEKKSGQKYERPLPIRFVGTVTSGNVWLLKEWNSKVFFPVQSGSVSGLATSAKQDIGNTSLAQSIYGFTDVMIDSGIYNAQQWREILVMTDAIFTNLKIVGSLDLVNAGTASAYGNIPSGAIVKAGTIITSPSAILPFNYINLASGTLKCIRQ